MTTITRRRFLQGLGAGGALLATGCGGSGGSDTGGGTPPTALPKKPILVVVFLDGGNDWLSMMPPLSGPNRTAYEAARPTLAVPTSALVDLGGGVGLHRDFTGMADLHARGRVAWIPGIGMNNPNLSHFVSTDLWGQGSAQPAGTGWLGRFADAAFAPAADVLRGVTVTNDLPVMLRGQGRSFVSITGSSGFVYPAALRSGRLGSPWDAPLLQAGFDASVSSVDVGAPPGYAVGAREGKAF